MYIVMEECVLRKLLLDNSRQLRQHRAAGGGCGSCLDLIPAAVNVVLGLFLSNTFSSFLETLLFKPPTLQTPGCERALDASALG